MPIVALRLPTSWVRKADVFAQSYRPRSISSIFPPDEMAALRPGIVYVSLSCYGFEGPWRNRPGWEQLAQSATGIAAFEGSLEEPKLAEGFFPNDYITGFLAAIGTLAALIRRATEGGSWHVKVSLCRTAMILLDQGQADASAKTAAPPPEVLRRFMMESDSALGRLHFLGPVLRYTETPSRWDLPASPLGAHPPCWPQWARRRREAAPPGSCETARDAAAGPRDDDTTGGCRTPRRSARRCKP
jgi:hypothetical protein